MAWTVSVRNPHLLEDALRNEKDFSIPEECRRNSDVIWTLLQYGNRVLPGFDDIPKAQVLKIAEGVSYLLRPDFIIEGSLALMGPNPFFPSDKADKVADYAVHLRNDPSKLHLGFQVDRKIMSDPDFYRGAEFFRCYGAIFSFTRDFKKRIPSWPTYNDAFVLADMTVFLLDPGDLTEYKYTPSEINTFNAKLKKEAEDI